MKPLSLIGHLNVRRLRHGLALGVTFVTWLFLASPAHASDGDSASLAASVPIADVHMHLYRGLTPDELRAAMDRNNVRWGGGVGPVGPGYDPLEFSKVLGPRYFPAGAQAQQFVMFQAGGANELASADSPRFKALMEQLAGQFERKEISGVGELVLNNHRSSAMPGFARKVRIDAESLQAMYALAQKHQGYVQLHMDDDPDSIEQIESMARRYPDVPFILSHCMTRASAPAARAVLERHANLYCETSYRSTARNGAPGLRPYMIHTADSADSAWLAVIEALPERFMVGSDIYTKDVSYDAVIAAIRSGLLARLTPATLKKVAYENAQRVFRLPQP
jgi:predicted TIM-barrel fold metal-dependent hydrolase